MFWSQGPNIWAQGPSGPGPKPIFEVLSETVLELRSPFWGCCPKPFWSVEAHFGGAVRNRFGASKPIFGVRCETVLERQN